MNLEIIKNGITLKKINQNDLELIRNWRNSDFVKQFMVFQEYITEEMEFNWFQKIDNDKNYYFLIVIDNKPIGLANIKDINILERSGETGIFLGEERFTNGVFGALAAIVLLDFAFYDLKLIRLTQSILEKNRSAVSFNKRLGVKVLYENDGIIKTELNLNNYEAKVSNLKKILL